jgi:hypothetical protein
MQRRRVTYELEGIHSNFDRHRRNTVRCVDRLDVRQTSRTRTAERLFVDSLDIFGKYGWRENSSSFNEFFGHGTLQSELAPAASLLSGRGRSHWRIRRDEAR